MMNVEINIGKGIICNGTEILFGNNISSILNQFGEVTKIKNRYYFFDAGLLVVTDSHNCIEEIEVRNDDRDRPSVMVDGVDVFSVERAQVVSFIERLNQGPATFDLGTYDAERIGFAYGFSMEEEDIEEMIAEAKEEGYYERMKTDIEADIERAKYLETLCIHKV